MSLTRKLLSTMGLNEDQVEQIIEAHTETVNAIKEERDNFKAEAEKLPGVQKELDKLKKAVENKEESPYKAQYEQAVEEKTKLGERNKGEKGSGSACLLQGKEHHQGCRS